MMNVDFLRGNKFSLDRLFSVFFFRKKKEDGEDCGSFRPTPTAKGIPYDAGNGAMNGILNGERSKRHWTGENVVREREIAIT